MDLIDEYNGIQKGSWVRYFSIQEDRHLIAEVFYIEKRENKKVVLYTDGGIFNADAVLEARKAKP